MFYYSIYTLPHYQWGFDFFISNLVPIFFATLSTAIGSNVGQNMSTGVSFYAYLSLSGGGTSSLLPIGSR